MNTAFANLYQFPFPLLCDTTRELCLAYGTCQRATDRGAQRVTYVIGPDRRILQVYSAVNPIGHVDEILAFLDQANQVAPSGSLPSSGEPPRFVLMTGDAQEVMRGLPEGSVHCCLTSPPAWMGPNVKPASDGGVGGEDTPDAYVAKLVDTFGELRRLLRDDGTFWLLTSHYHTPGAEKIPKQLAAALQADGWRFERPFRWVRPASLEGAHESDLDGYVLLLTKTNQYRVNPSALPSDVLSFQYEPPPPDFGYLTTPETLIEPFMLAGSQAGDIVLDPFCGAGSEGIIALKQGRHFVGIDTNADYLQVAARRIGEAVPHAVGELPTPPPVAKVMPSQNGDGRGKLIYALGTIGYDFGTDAHRDTLLQAMTGTSPNPDDPAQLLAHLNANPEQEQAVLWTLKLNEVPIYAIHPTGTFATRTYQLLREFLDGQLADGVERVSIPGILTGQHVRLRSGQVVPVVAPDPRGMFSWSTDALIDALGGEPGGGAQGLPFTLRPAYRMGLNTMRVSRNLRERFREHGIQLSSNARVTGEDNNWQIIDGDTTYLIQAGDNQLNVSLQGASASASPTTETGRVRNFLARVYHELRNRGVTPQERAINYAATNIFQAREVFEHAIQASLELDDIAVEHSSITRYGSDCWDVKLTFFSPQQRLQRAKKAYRFTVDVSDVVPVTVGETRSWSIYER